MQVWAKSASFILLLGFMGCLEIPVVPSEQHRHRILMELETMSVKVWAEEEPLFAGVRPKDAAIAWRNNLRGLGVKAQFMDRALSVAGETPQGERFSLVFWAENGPTTRTRGRLVWDDPHEADKGMIHLIDKEYEMKKNR